MNIIRKGMAALLAVAMIFTSQSFASIVSASEVSEQSIVQEADSEQSIEASVSEKTEATETVEQELQNDLDKSSEAIKTEESGESATISDVSSDKAVATEDVDDSQVEDKVPNIEENIENLEASEDIESLEADSDVKESVVEEADVSNEKETISEDEAIEVEDGEPTFITVLKDGKYYLQRNPADTDPFPRNVDIPDEAQIIPADSELFANNNVIETIYMNSSSNLEEIQEGAFKGASALREVYIPYGIETIPKDCFSGDTSLKDIYFYDSKNTANLNKSEKITAIGVNAFLECALTKITMNACTKVGERAFQNNKSLTTVVMNNLRIIDDYAFSGCSKLSAGIEFGESMELIGNYAFASCGFTDVSLEKAYKLISTATTNGTQNPDPTIGVGVFMNNTKLESIYLMDKDGTNLTYLPDRMFEGCTALVNKITIPYNMVAIGKSSFSGCTRLSTIDLTNVRYVNSKAFEDCKSLREIIMSYKDETGATHVSISADAFPKLENVTVTMRGFDSEVRVYANKKGYRFISKYPSYTVKVVSQNVSVGIVKAQDVEDQDKRYAGSIVTLLVKADDGYMLKNIKLIGVDSKQDYSKTKTNAPYYDGTNTDGNYIFRFVMPNEPVNVEIAGVKASSMSKVMPTWSFEAIDKSDDLEGTDTSYSWTRRGQRAKIKIQAGTEVYGNWLYDFKSSKPGYVTVDSEGMITGIMEGDSKITVTAKYNSNISFYFYVYVGGALDIGQVYVGKDDEEKAFKLIDAGSYGTVSVDPVTKYPVVTFIKDVVGKSSQSIDVNIEAYKWTGDTNKAIYNTAESYFVKSNWASADTKIATVQYATSSSNHNVINVNRNSEGEALISISTINYGEGEANGWTEKDPDNYLEDNIAYIIVRVIDITPRLSQSKITVNNQLKFGTPISVVPVYGYDINTSGKQLYIAPRKLEDGQYKPNLDSAAGKQFKVVKYTDDLYRYYEGNPTKEEMKESVSEKHTKAHYNDGFWYITTPQGVSLPAGKDSIEYTNLYLWGEYADTSQGMFSIPITSLILKNEQLKPEIKQSGTINLFYNKEADKDYKDYEKNKHYYTKKVSITQSLSAYEVDGYRLVSVDNSKRTSLAGERSEMLPVTNKMVIDGEEVDYDSFAYNFDINTVDDKIKYPNKNAAEITRSNWHDNLATVGGKNVTGGYLYIYYTEYKDPVKVKLNVKTENKAPVYKLSQTSVTTYNREINQVYPLYLYDTALGGNSYANRVKLDRSYIANYDSDDNPVSIDSKNRFLQIQKYNTTVKVDQTEKELYNLNLDTDYKGLLNDYIRIKLNEGVMGSSGNVRIALHMTTWSDPNKYLYYDFKIKTTSTLKAVANKATTTLNTAWVDAGPTDGVWDTQIIKFTTTSSDAKVTRIEKVEYVEPKALNKRDGYATLKQMLSNGTVYVLGDEITLRQPTAKELPIASGTYTFTIKTTATINNATEKIDLAPIKINIKVVNSKPTVSVGTITLNVYAKSEIATAKLKLGNLIAGTSATGYTVVTKEGDASEPVKYTKSKTVYYDGCYEDESNLSDCFDTRIADYTYVPATSTVAVTRGKDFLTKTQAGTYTVTGVKMRSPGGVSVADVTKYKIKLVANTKRPSVSIKKTTGGINMVLPGSEIVYTTVINNVAGTITGVKVFDDSASGNPEASRFYAYQEGTTNGKDKIIHVCQRTDFDSASESGWNNEEMKAGKTYQLALYFGLSAMDGYDSEHLTTDNADCYTRIKIKPYNTFPKVTVGASKTYAYAGQDRTKDTWDIKVTAQLETAYRGKDVTLKNPDGTESHDNMKCVVKDVDWYSSLSKSLKDEFTIVPGTFKYDAATGKITFDLRLRNAAELAQNKTYELKFVPKIKELQVNNLVDGKPFSIKINVRK